MKAFKKQEGVKWYICAWKKRCTVQDFIWTGFRFSTKIWTNFGPKSCTHYIAEKFDKSQKTNPFLITFFCFFFQLIFVIFDLFPQSFLFLNDITNPAYQVWGEELERWKEEFSFPYTNNFPLLGIFSSEI